MKYCFENGKNKIALNIPEAPMFCRTSDFKKLIDIAFEYANSMEDGYSKIHRIRDDIERAIEDLKRVSNGIPDLASEAVDLAQKVFCRKYKRHMKPKDYEKCLKRAEKALVEYDNEMTKYKWGV